MAQACFSNIKKTFFALRSSFTAGKRVFKATRWPSKTDASFEPLIPALLEGDRFERYERELLGALNNHEVLNIALTGGYGAGKSSVVKTFLERNPQFPSVTVSLATFSKSAPKQPSVAAETENADKSKVVNGASRAENEGSSTPELINRIEETIVQQLLYAVRADQLPKTRFKRIIQASNSVIYLRAMLLVAWLISILRIWMPTLEKQTSLDIDWVVKGLMLVPELLAVSVTAVGGVYFVYTVLKFFSMFSIDGLTLKGGKLEATHHGSVLHKNVDEIIYCFERSNTRIVVIEDLDRYDIQDIFFRLREINFTIRHSPQIKRPVHFIYAIRDELFTVTDKTKFFDLIIPVIPVVNSENSHEKMTELMRVRSHNGVSLGARIDPAVVETVCYYIDEMRLIKSIVNEYDIYLGLLAKDGLELDPNKLFAVIVLRNLHPHAYANLIKRQGPVHNVLSGFSEWIRQEVKALQNRIDGLREQLLEKKNEVLSTTAHLRAGVWYEILRLGGMPNANTVVSSEGVSITLQQFVEDSSFNSASFYSGRVRPYLNSPFGNSAGNYVETSQILKAMNYQARAGLLQLSVEAVEIEITELQKQITSLRTMSFREAARKQYGPVIAGELIGLEIVTYFMRRGLFDTDYVDYLGYFYEGTLTQADKNFILAVGRGEMLDVATPLQNPLRVVTKLDYECLEDGKGIIAGLIGALVPPGHSDSAGIDDQKLTIILKSGHQHLDRMAEAVHLMLEDSVGPTLIQMIFKKDQNLMYQLLQADRFKLGDARLLYVCTILDNLTADQLDGMADRKSSILKAVSSLTDVSKLIPSMESNQAGWKWLRSKPAQFYNVGDMVTSSEIRQLIAWGCMKLSLPMIQMIWRKLSPEAQEVSLVSYAGLGSLSLAGLQQSIESNPEAFIEELLGQEGTLPETADSLERLLQLAEDDLELSEKLLDRTDCPVSDLRKTPRQVWVRLLADNRVMLVPAVWTVFDDVVDAPSTNAAEDEIKAQFEDALLDFLDRNAEQLSGELWEVNPERDRALQSYLLRKGVSRDILNKLLAKIVLDPNVVLGSNIPPERWGLIAHARFVPYALEIRNAFRALAPRLEGDYLRRCWRDAREDLDLTSLPIDVVWQLTRLDTVSIQDALTMWAGIPYEAFDTCEGAAVELARVCQRANAAGASFPEDYLAVILQVINDGDLSREGRIHMLIQALTLNCDRAQILVAVTLLGGEYLHLNQKPQVKLPKSTGDQRLLETLHRRSFIGKIRVEDKHIVAYRRR